MPSLLERIRNKSPEEKKKMIIWISAVVMVIVIALWALLFFGFGGMEQAKAESAQSASQLGSIKQGFEAIMKMFKK